MPGGFQSPSSVLIASKTLTAAQVLAIFTTPQTIIPAPGPGNMIDVLGIVQNYTYKGTPYVDGGGNMVLGFGGLGLWQFATLGYWDQAASQLLTQVPITTGQQTLAVSNLALTLSHTVANPTAGNGTISVTVAYTIVPVA